MHEDFYGIDRVDAEVYRVAHGYRDPMTGKRGIGALAERMNCNAGTLQNKVNVRNLTHDLSVREFRQILMHGGDLGPLEALVGEFKQVLMQAPGAEGGDTDSLFDVLLKVDVEKGELGHALHEAFRDGALSREESQWISKEIRDVMRALATLDALQQDLAGEG